MDQRRSHGRVLEVPVSKGFTMRNIQLLLAVLGCLFFFGHSVQAADPAPGSANADASAPAASTPEIKLVARGEYVARLGDCLACHTSDKGPAMAG